MFSIFPYIFSTTFNAIAGNINRFDNIVVNVVNNIDGQYLWIVTRRPVTMAIAINGGADSNNRSYGVQSAMCIPLTRAMHKQYPNDELYYYACPNPMIANNNIGGDNIFVKFE